MFNTKLPISSQMCAQCHMPKDQTGAPWMKLIKTYMIRFKRILFNLLQNIFYEHFEEIWSPLRGFKIHNEQKKTTQKFSLIN